MIPNSAVALLLFSAGSAIAAAGTPISLPASRCDEVRRLVEAAAQKQFISAAVDCPALPGKGSGDAPGALRLSVHGIRWISGPSRLDLESVAPNGRTTAAAIQVQMTLGSMAWLARHNVQGGEIVRADDFEWAQFVWPRGTALKQAPVALPAGRLRHALRVADRLDESNLARQDQRLQGDDVTVLWRGKGIALEAPATLVADASVGGRARVQVKGHRESLTGVLVDASTLVLER